ncbi:MAG: hypothetical protein ABI183_24000, partial [Polyangiaceae bacterium]
MIKRLRGVTCVVTCTLTTCMSMMSVAHADPSAAEIESARKLFKQAEADETAGKWDVALAEIHRASAIKMTAGLRFHIALCESNLHQNAAALSDYTAADLLARAEKNSEVQEAVREPRADLEARVPKVKLTVPNDAKNLEVRIDSTVVTDLTEDVRLDTGAHDIEARADGRAPFSKKLNLQERDSVTIAITLPSLTQAPPKSVDAPTDEEPAANGSSKRNYVPAILATAGAVVLVGAGIGSFLVAGGAQTDARTACTSGSTDCSGDKSQVHVWDAVALGAWIGAAGVGALAVVLWVDAPSRKSDAA